MKTSLIALLIVFCQNLSAQTILEGIITDEQGATLPGANVYLENTFDGTSSNGKGYFSFSTDEKGTQVLIIEFVGFEGQRIPLDLNGGKISRQVTMKEAFSRLDAVTITTGAFEAGDQQRSPALTSMDVVTTAGAMADVAAAMQSLPGTTRVGESGRLFVRGGDANETNTFIDGMWVPTPYTSNLPNMNARGRFNPFLFSGTIFSTGGYSAEYGQALSSVLLLNTTDVKQEDQLNLSFLSVGMDFAGTKTWADQSITASATYYNLAPYLELVKPNQTFTTPPSSTGNEISYKLKTGKHGLFKAYSNFNHSQSAIERYNLDAGAPVNYDLNNSNYYISTSWRGPVSDKWTLMAGNDLQWDWDVLGIDDNQIRNRLRAGHAKAVADYDHSDRVGIRFGAECFNERLEQAYEFDADRMTREFGENLFAGFGEGNLYVSEKFVLRPGVRLEYSSALHRSNVAPRLSAAYKVGRDSQLSFAVGQFYQKPYREDLIIDSDLDYQRADHYTFNYQVISKGRIFRLEGYLKNYQNLTRERSGSDYDNTGHGYAYGMDLFYRDNTSVEHGQFWVSYSFLETKRNYRDFPAMAVPSFAAKHSVALVYKHWLPGPKMMLGSDFNISSKRRYNDPNMEYFNAARMPVYHNLNLNVAWLLTDQKILYAAASNVLNRKNNFGYEFASQQNDAGIYEKQKITGFSNQFFVVGFFLTLSKDNTLNQLDKIN